MLPTRLMSILHLHKQALSSKPQTPKCNANATSTSSTRRSLTSMPHNDSFPRKAAALRLPRDIAVQTTYSRRPPNPIPHCLHTLSPLASPAPLHDLPMQLCAHDWCPHILTRHPQRNGHVLCPRHDAALHRAVRAVVEDWFRESTIRGMTPISELVWQEFLRNLYKEDEDGEGTMGRPSRGMLERM
jgi:hypothetical protein